MDFIGYKKHHKKEFDLLRNDIIKYIKELESLDKTN